LARLIERQRMSATKEEAASTGKVGVKSEAKTEI